MFPKGVHIEGVPPELEALLVGSAKQEATRQTRAKKAPIMLQKGQKTLKT
jgi:hypothetical protein